MLCSEANLKAQLCPNIVGHEKVQFICTLSSVGLLGCFPYTQLFLISFISKNLSLVKGLLSLFTLVCCKLSLPKWLFILDWGKTWEIIIYNLYVNG